MFEKNEPAIEHLRLMSKSGTQSILISGPNGSGKTYCANLFHKFAKTEDFILVDPRMGDIRDMLVSVGESATVCIENIDTGMLSVSQAVLKFIETPPKGVHIIITCRRIDTIPETILSRCSHIALPPVSSSDLIEYAKQKYPQSADAVIRKQDIWYAATTTKDVDWLCSLNEKNLESLSSIYTTAVGAGAVSSIVWKLQHFSDSSLIDTEFVMKYMMRNGKTKLIRDIFRRALDDIAMRIPAHVALSKAVLSMKYEVAL
jgi:hypothetical protein